MVISAAKTKPILKSATNVSKKLPNYSTKISYKPVNSSNRLFGKQTGQLNQIPVTITAHTHAFDVLHTIQIKALKSLPSTALTVFVTD